MGADEGAAALGVEGDTAASAVGLAGADRVVLGVGPTEGDVVAKGIVLGVEEGTTETQPIAPGPELSQQKLFAL